MTLAFQTPYKPTPKLILLALCDFSDDKGISFPSLNTLKDKCTVGKTNLTYVLRAFESINLLRKEKRKRENGSDTSTMYYIHISKLNSLATIDEKFEDSTQAKIQKERYISEFESAYKRCKGSLSEHPKVHSVNSLKNHLVNRGVHLGEHLEPSYNHQEEISKDISSSKRRESFNDFKKRIIDHYTNQPLVYGAADYSNATLLTLSALGYIHNTHSNKDLCREDAIAVWQWLYINQNKLIPLKDKQHV